MNSFIRALFLISTFLSCAVKSYSITTIPLFAIVKSVPKTMGVSVPTSAGLFQNNATAFRSLSNCTSPFEVQSFPITASNVVDLELTPFQILAPNAMVCMGTAQGDVVINQNEATFLRGHVKGDPNSFVYLAVFQNHTSGYIEYTNTSQRFERVVVAPTSVEKGVNSIMVVSQEEQTDLRVQCETESMPNYHTEVKKSFEILEEYKKNSEKPLNSQTLVSTLAVECNYDFYKNHNFNLTETINYALTVIGAASAIFERDVNIVFHVNYLRVWTVPDPFMEKDNAEINYKFGSYWYNNMRHISNSFTILLSGTFLGGVAYDNRLCLQNDSNFTGRGHCVAGMEKNNVFPTNNFVGEINTLTHELGHLYGTPHTHSCAWGPPIDSCYIRDGGGECFSGIKSSTGTIMSYCYLNSKVNLLKFHPRVASFIRAFGEKSTCLTNYIYKDSINLGIENVLIPQKGSTISKNSSFAPSVCVKNFGSKIVTNAKVYCFISNRDSNYIHSYHIKKVLYIDSILQNEVKTFTFETVTLDLEDYYQITFVTETSKDTTYENNILSIPFQVGQTKNEKITIEPILSGQVYQVGDSFPISWKTSLFGDIRIEYSFDNGITWSQVISRIPAQNNNYIWKIPSSQTSLGKIKISSFEESSIFTVSDFTFSIEVKNDIQPIWIKFPHSRFRDYTEINDTNFTAEIIVRNNSNYEAQNITLKLEIFQNYSSSLVFVDTILLEKLLPLSDTLIKFKKFRNPGAEYKQIGYFLKIYSNLYNDQNRENDTLYGAFRILYYDISKKGALLLTPKDNGFASFIPKLTWNTGYYPYDEEVLLELDTNKTFTNPIIQVAIKDTVFYVTDLPAEPFYYWRVKRISNGIWSHIWQFKMLNWIYNPSNGNYYSEVDAGSAEMALEHAKFLGAYPLTIRSKEENDWIQTTFGNKITWLGYSKKGNNNKWYWYNGDETTFTNWALNQPDNFKGKENCAAKIEDGTWADMSEFMEYRSIFEVKGTISSIENPKGGVVAELYPNPTSGEFSILFKSSFESVTVKLLSLQGMEVLKQTYSNVTTIPISATNIANGSYTLVLQTEDGTFTTSIVILK